jgi:hypothetical protein
MIFSTAVRNSMYVHAYGLTEKRIGVYVYLLLAAIGLLTTGLKIFRSFSNSYLIRLNSWIFYAVLIVASFIGWDKMIANYNLKRTDAFYNFNYMLNLSDSTLPKLSIFLFQHSNKLNKEISTRSNKRINDCRLSLSYKVQKSMQQREKFKGWKSWNYTKEQTYKSLIYFVPVLPKVPVKPSEED